MVKKVLIVLFLTSYAWADWTPPIGIPDPEWGIDTTHWMFSGETYNYVDDGGVLTYRESPDGPYTHYIKPSDPASTDTSNPYGTVAKPRKTVNVTELATVAAGSVYQIWGPVQIADPPGHFRPEGTAADPVFIIGKEGYAPTWEDDLVSVDCSYLILEGIKFIFGPGNPGAFLNPGYAGNSQSHIAIRKCEFTGGNFADGPHYGIALRNKTGSAGTITNIVIYDNWFHHINDDRDDNPDDALGVYIDAYVSNVWIVDNLFHHIGGDSAHAAHDYIPAVDAARPHHIYFGRNTSHDNYENSIDLKKCADVIISQNIAYNFGTETYDLANEHSYAYRQGPGDIGKDYDQGRTRIWTIFNLTYNSTSHEGCYLLYHGGKAADPPTDIYFIGNVSYNVHRAAGNAPVFQHYNQKKVYYVNNTIYDADLGGVFYVNDSGDADEACYLVNNIFESWTSTGDDGFMVLGTTKVEADPSFANVTMKNNIFYRSGAAGNLTVRRRPSSYADTEYTWAEFGAWKAAFVVGSFEDNPDFVNPGNHQLQLLEESPAVDAGFDAETDIYDVFYALYGIDIKVDFDGNPVTEEWDIGAFQFQSEEPPGPPDYHDHYVYVDPDAGGDNDGGRDATDPNDPTDEDNWTDAYESLSEAEDGEDGADLPATNRVLIFCCRNSGGSPDTTAVVFSGTTTDSTRYIQVEGYAGDRHAGVYNTDKYHMTGTDTIRLTINDDYVRIIGLQFGITTTANNNSKGIAINTVGSSGIYIQDCIFAGIAVTGTGTTWGMHINDADATVYIFNSIFYNLLSANTPADTEFMGIYNQNSSATNVWNCTFNDNNTGIRGLGGTVNIANSLAFENVGATFDFRQCESITYCATDDTYAGTGNFVISQTTDDYGALVVDADGRNYDVKDASSELWDAGTDDPGGDSQGDPDIAGVTRETNWDIGAFEGPVQAGPSNPYYPLLHAVFNQ